MLRALRIRHWAHFLLLPLGSAGALSAPSATYPALARGLGIAFLTLAFGYLINGLSDRNMDASAEKNALVGSAVGRRRVIAVLWVLVAAAILLAVWAPRAVLVATVVTLLSGTIYSVGPRLKRLPVVGTLMNATNFAPMLWLGLPSGEPGGGDLWYLTWVFACLLLQNQVLHEAGDRSEDARGGVLTTARLLGARGGAVAVALLGVLLVPALWATPHLGWLGVALALPFVVAFPAMMLRHGEDEARMQRARVIHRFFSLAAGATVFGALRIAAG